MYYREHLRQICAHRYKDQRRYCDTDQLYSYTVEFPVCLSPCPHLQGTARPDNLSGQVKSGQIAGNGLTAFAWHDKTE